MRLKERQSFFGAPYDSRVGSSVATTKPKGLGKEYQMGSTYPYKTYLEDDWDDDEAEDTEDLISLYGIDMSSVNKFIRKINQGQVASDPAISNKRVDVQSMTTGQRLDLAEENDPGIRKGSSLYGSMSPIPFKRLYKKFSGPAVGGFSTMQANTTGPFMGTGTQFGSSRAPLVDDDGIRIYSFNDLITADERSYSRAQTAVRQKNDARDVN